MLMSFAYMVHLIVVDISDPKKLNPRWTSDLIIGSCRVIAKLKRQHPKNERGKILKTATSVDSCIHGPGLFIGYLVRSRPGA